MVALRTGTGVPPILLGLLAASTVACASAAPPPVTRTVGGERRTQTFVSPHAYEQYLRGELALAHGDPEAAVKAFRQARTGPADDPYVIARLADALDATGRRAQAEKVLDQGVELDPRSEAVWLARARIAERHGETERALAAYHRAELAAPRSVRAPLALARLLRQGNRPGRAEAILSRYVRRVPDTDPRASRVRLELALLRGDAPTAVRSARDLLERAPARAEVVRRTAELALEQGDPVVADELLGTLPRSHVPTALHVRVLIAAGYPDRAEALLASASPGEVGGLAAKARLYLAAGRSDRAEETAELAIALGDDPAARLVAGRAALAQAKWVEAAEHLSRVPPDVAAAPAARQALARALRAHALPHLAEELDPAADR